MSSSSSSSSSLLLSNQIKNSPYFCNPYPNKCLEDFRNFMGGSIPTYLIDRERTMPLNKVLEKFIENLNSIGFSGVNFRLVNEIYGLLCDGNDSNFNAHTITEYMFKLVGMEDYFFEKNIPIIKRRRIIRHDSQLDKFKEYIKFSSKYRKIFNIEGDQLSLVTKIGENSIRDNHYVMKKEKYDEISYPDTDEITLTGYEFEWVNNCYNPKKKVGRTIKTYRSLAHKITDNEKYKTSHIGKKWCGTCWLCGERIYYYKYTFEHKDNPDVKKYLFKSCGEDEHVFPPGVGNLLGTLYHNKEYSLSALRTPKSLSHFGIYASHSLCNQVKNRKYFYKIDKDTGEFKSNDENIENFLEKWGERRSRPDPKRRISGHQREEIFRIRATDDSFLDQSKNDIRGNIHYVNNQIGSILNFKKIGDEVKSIETRENYMRVDSIKCKMLFYMTHIFLNEILKKCISDLDRIYLKGMTGRLPESEVVPRIRRIITDEYNRYASISRGGARINLDISKDQNFIDNNAIYDFIILMNDKLEVILNIFKQLPNYIITNEEQQPDPGINEKILAIKIM